MPRVVDHGQRRRELIAATWSVIAAEGLEAATVRRIAEAAGCTTGRVTHYFESKDAVLVAALRRVHAAAGERMARVPADLPPVERLRRILLESLPMDDERRLEWRVWLTFWGRAASSEALLREHRARYAEWRRVVRDALAATSPSMGRRRIDTASEHLVALVDGLGVQAVLEPEVVSIARVRRVVEDAIANATVAAPA